MLKLLRILPLKRNGLLLQHLRCRMGEYGGSLRAP